MSFRYAAGYTLIRLRSLLIRVFHVVMSLASIPEQLALIVWTTTELDQYSRARWDSSKEVRRYERLEGWLDDTEKGLVEKYFTNGGEVLNLACGAGREGMLLAKRGVRVTACDWSPQMIAAAQLRARAASLSIRFEVADLYNLQYPENAFDYLLVTNIAYSYFFPRRRRVHLLKQAYSVLKPGGVFIISFGTYPTRSAHGFSGIAEWLCTGLGRYAPFNRDYEPGDRVVPQLTHFFRPEGLTDEVRETQFAIQEWRWDEGYVVLAKAGGPQARPSCTTPVFRCL